MDRISASNMSQSPAGDDRRRTLVKRERGVHTGWSKEVELRTEKDREMQKSDEQVGKYWRGRERRRVKRKEF